MSARVLGYSVSARVFRWFPSQPVFFRWFPSQPVFLVFFPKSRKFRVFGVFSRKVVNFGFFREFPGFAVLTPSIGIGLGFDAMTTFYDFSAPLGDHILTP